MLNKLLLTALVLMLSHTTVYAGVDCDKNADCKVADFLARIDGIDQLKARVVVKPLITSQDIEQECTPTDWVGNCKIDTLSSGPGWYSATVSFGVTAPLSGFHCDYYGSIYFYFDGTYQVVEKIPLSGKCYWWDETTATAATD